MDDGAVDIRGRPMGQVCNATQLIDDVVNAHCEKCVAGFEPAIWPASGRYKCQEP
jgi:hypothetical protein